LDEDGKNQPGKQCIVVPVNIERKDAPARFSSGTRIWVVGDRHRNLLATWRGLERQNDFVKKVADEIFRAAREHIAQPASPAGTVDLVEMPGGRWDFQHHADTIVGPRARLARLGAEIAAETGGPASSDPPGLEIVPKLADWACSRIGPRLTALLGEFGMGK